MKFNIFLVFNVAILSLLCSAKSAIADVNFTDGTFANSDWTLDTLLAGNGGSVSAGQVGSGGNPGSYRTITNNVATPGGVSSIVHGRHMNTIFSYDPATQGAIQSFNFSLDYLTIGGIQVGIGLMVEQNGQLYVSSPYGYTIVSSGSWQTLTVNGILPSDFVSYDTNNRDLNAFSGTLHFGFLAANSASPSFSGYSATTQVDNFRTLVVSSSAPEPSSLVLLLAGGFLIHRRTRQ